MSKHLGRLVRLQTKLASLYGENDSLAVALKDAADARAMLSTRTRRLSFPRSLFSVGRAANRRQIKLSVGTK